MGAFLERLEPFLVWLVQTSLQASVLLCLVLLVQWAFRGKLPARWRYGLWVLVLVRMALPIAPQSDLSVFNFINVDLRNTYPTHRADSSPGVDATASLAGTDAAVSSENGLAGQAAGLTEQSLRAGGTSTSKPTQADVNGPPTGLSDSFASQAFMACCHTAWTVFAYVWPVGALLLVARLAVATVGLRRRTSALPACTDGRVLEMLEAAKAQMGVTMHVPVLVSSSLQSPALAGVLRPKLLLPIDITNTLTAEELRYVFLHELAHLKRLDLPVNLLMIVLVILHWFNPLLWYALRRMRADRELACDALMLSRAQPGDHKGYGLTLIKLLQTAVCPPALTPGMVGILEDSEQIKTRIRMIARFRVNADRRCALGAGLLIMLGVVSLTNASARPAEFLQPTSTAKPITNEPAPLPLAEPAVKVQSEANPPDEPIRRSPWGQNSPWAGLAGNFGLPTTDVSYLAGSASTDRSLQGFGRRFYSEDTNGLTITNPRTSVVSVLSGGGWDMTPANDSRPGAVNRRGIGQNVLDLIAQPGAVNRSRAGNPSPSQWETASGSTARATITRAPAIAAPLQVLIQQLDDEPASAGTSNASSTAKSDRPTTPATTVWQVTAPSLDFDSLNDYPTQFVITGSSFTSSNGNGCSVQSVNAASSLSVATGSYNFAILASIDARLVGTIDSGLVDVTFNRAIRGTFGGGGSRSLLPPFPGSGNPLIRGPIRPGPYGPQPLNGGSYGSVPEPATLGLLAVGGVAMLRRRRR